MSGLTNRKETGAPANAKTCTTLKGCLWQPAFDEVLFTMCIAAEVATEVSDYL